MNPRADFKIAEHIYRTQGLAALREWHSLPFVEIDSKQALKAVGENSKNDYTCLEHLMWPDAIYYSGGNKQEFADRVKTGDPWNIGCASGITQAPVVASVVSFSRDLATGVVVYDSCHIHYDPDRPAEDGRVQFCMTGEIRPGFETPTAEMLGRIFECTLTILSFVSGQHFYPVQVSPNLQAKSPRQVSKTAKHKPWARTDLPSIVLIDFKAAERCGWRGGTHATPSPHQRRGHWRTYRAECWGNLRGQRRWVRPAWVGDREWVFNGTRYRVVEPIQY